VASLAGACLFAVTTGAGAVFVGDWWGQHHGSVTTVYVTTTASAPGTSHAAVAAHPKARHPRPRASASEVADEADGWPDPGAAQVAHVTPAASHHPSPSRTAHPAPAGSSATTVTPSLGGSPGPGGTGSEPAPVVAPTPGVTHSPGHPSR
jgi:hypothetical protein